MNDRDFMNAMPDLLSQDRKRLILIVEDEDINREILRYNLEQDYEILLADNGTDALDCIHGNAESLSLVLLDLNLPDLHGLDILRGIKEDSRLARIPVIVLTSDTEAEVESLNIGASDFISKPYPMPEVIRARVRKTIELSENRDLIRWTERDHLTGLYNREYFFRYAEQYDTYHRDEAKDAIVVDVSHFRLINERFGKAFADDVLRRIGAALLSRIRNTGGIVSRREADTFQVYCPHLPDYTTFAESVSAAACGEDRGRIRLRIGIYSCVDQAISMELRFDRAKMAADTLRNDFSNTVAVYDNALHEKEIYEERLLDDFHEAMDRKQFTVYFQPKYDIRPAVPVLYGAEALVRWKHPELGMVSPGVFIPLFESNGLVRELDNYVWREAAAQLRDWKDRLGYAVPVSVNVSRIDMLDPDLVDTLLSLITEYGLASRDLHLEITESAYTQDAGQIISTVKALREMGFIIEMDDFGSGYSSLNMISTLPIDALKLDMLFIRNAFSEQGNTRMLEVTFDISDSLSVPMIAEGVETAEQMLTLKAMGCDIVQGYFFSRPLPAAEFESFLLERRLSGDAGGCPDGSGRIPEKTPFHEKFTYDALRDPLTGLYNRDGFDRLCPYTDRDHTALLVILLANLPDDGEAAGGIIRKASEMLRGSFHASDLVCRLREDEFVIVMTRPDSTSRGFITERISRISAGLNPVSLIAGAAFPDRKNPGGDLLTDAEAALQRAVRTPGSLCEFC